MLVPAPKNSQLVWTIMKTCGWDSRLANGWPNLKGALINLVPHLKTMNTNLSLLKHSYLSSFFF